MSRESPSFLSQVFVVGGIVFLLPRIMAVLAFLWAVGLLIQFASYFAAHWQTGLAVIAFAGMVIGALIVRPVTMGIALALIGVMTLAEFRWLNSLG